MVDGDGDGENLTRGAGHFDFFGDGWGDAWGLRGYGDGGDGDGSGGDGSGYGIGDEAAAL